MLGGNPAEFWRLTLKQVILFFDGHKERRKQEQELAYYQAYMSGLFSQAYEKNKFPDYEKFAPWKKAHSKPQDWKQQKMIAQAINAAFGGTVSEKVH